MKVVAFNGSPRKNGNTSILIKHVFAELEKEGIECELVHLKKGSIAGCVGCYGCIKNQNRRCVFENDIVNESIEKITKADGIILGSPTYFANVTAEMKAFIDRIGFVAKVNGDILKHKVGAGVVAVRRGGAISVFNALNEFFLISQMIIPGSCYWNIGVGRDIGDVEQDEEGIRTMELLGQNMAWLIKKIKA